MKNYKQIRDVIGAVKDFHRQLSEFYTNLSETANKERVGMLLDYMSRHEKNFQKAMAEYNDEVAGELLNTWIQYTPDSGELSLPDIKNIDKDLTVDDVVNIVKEMDDTLVKFYSYAAQLVKTKEAKMLFNKMKEQEEGEKRKIFENAEDIKRI